MLLPAIGPKEAQLDQTGFGVQLADAPADAETIPHSLIDPPAGAPAAAQPPAHRSVPSPSRSTSVAAASVPATTRATTAKAGTASATPKPGLLAPAGRGVAALFNGSGSPWVQPIPAGAAIDPDSDGPVSKLAGMQFQMSYKLWTVPVYYADPGTPRYDVASTAGWGPGLKDVPIPDDAAPDPSEDAHLAIVDKSGGCVYDFWGASGHGGGLSAKLANAIPIDSTGIYPGGLGSRGSGFSAAAGIVTPEDLRKGSIDHALVFAYPGSRSGGFVAPATKSDGESSGPGSLPEGARVRLDPSIDLGSLGLNSYELMIAKAMQRYGMILGDRSGGFTIYAQHPQSVRGAGYDGILPDETWVDLSRIPTNRLQVLQLPSVQPNNSEVVGNRCNGF